MSLELEAPDEIVVGEPIPFRYRSDTRVAGRVRLTAGTEVLSIRLDKDGVVSEPATSHRVRGRSGTFRIVDWGEHAAGDELVLRFEGRKAWMTVRG